MSEIKFRIDDRKDGRYTVTIKLIGWRLDELVALAWTHSFQDTRVGRWLIRATDERRTRRATCHYCGGPNDHGRDCLPASQGGTMPDTTRIG